MSLQNEFILKVSVCRGGLGGTERQETRRMSCGATNKAVQSVECSITEFREFCIQEGPGFCFYHLLCSFFKKDG